MPFSVYPKGSLVKGSETQNVSPTGQNVSLAQVMRRTSIES